MKLNLLSWQSDLTSGGIQNTTYLLAEQFDKLLGEDFILFEESNSMLQSGINTVLIKFKGWWRFYFEMIKYLKNERRADFNLCMLWMCGISGYLYKKKYGVPYGVMIYGNDVIEAKKKSLKRRIKNKIRKIVLNNADIIFSCSNYSIDLCKRISHNNKLVVVYPPVLIKNTYERIKDPVNPIIFSIGRLVERKGFQDVIRAVSILKKKYPQIKYHIAGSGPYSDDLKKITEEEGLTDSVVFLGRVSEEKKKEEFENCSVFAMTSHEEIDNMEVEGFGIVYIEANMYGKWVIACDSGGVSDAVINGKTGTLIDMPDPNLIAAGIDEYLSLATKPSSEELKMWAEEFKPDKIAIQYIGHIDRIVEAEK